MVAHWNVPSPTVHFVAGMVIAPMISTKVQQDASVITVSLFSNAVILCSTGYRGTACTEKGSEEEELNYSPVLFGLIITLFVIIALLVVGIYFMIRQMAAFKEDITNYHVCLPHLTLSSPFGRL